MMRITELGGCGGAASLRVEGHITQNTVDELMSSSAACLASHPNVLLDLSGVRFVDSAGLKALRQLIPLGAVLSGCSGFLTELLRTDGPAELAERDPDECTQEAEVLDALRRGDEAAFEQLVREQGGRMLATARRLLNDEDAARDAVQDAFLSAFRAIATFSGTAKLSTWLHRIVVNAALMKIRSRRRKSEESIDDLLPRFDEHGEWVSGMATGDTPGDLFERRETRQMVRGCIDRLPDSYRVVLLLRDIEDLDTEEVADLLGITPNAVKIRLHRARQALRTLVEGAAIDRCGDTEGGAFGARSARGTVTHGVA